ncbi:cupin domain-containing protein [Streptomyces litchfieldiae]|uniref:Cupin domain-containing protein n=1 Tax=Streptomyces litchfieldiae TaxID=3075543 RepID=A0ABU2MPP8_9ACTN|nr:cupin domain-containing protein [Streptomyces sp. DSM 44938]MDT0342878.1 cupin domain-containing protein [Streptomyces sp. DSM 44938]
MVPAPTPDVLARMARLLSQAPPSRGGALWRLDQQGRQLDANVIRLAPGSEVAEHVEPDLDVLLFVSEGTGHLVTGAGTRELTPGSIAWLPHGTRRALSAGDDGLVYLTVHRRRPGLAIRTDAGEREGGETACLLSRVCLECGRFSPDADARYCGRCGAELGSV